MGNLCWLHVPGGNVTARLSWMLGICPLVQASEAGLTLLNFSVLSITAAGK